LATYWALFIWAVMRSLRVSRLLSRSQLVHGPAIVPKMVRVTFT
jgi:hypothetical protein